MTPIQVSFKKNEGYVYKNSLDILKKLKIKLQVNDLVRDAALRKIFSKGDKTKWSYVLNKITEINIDTTPSYYFDNLQERYTET